MSTRARRTVLAGGSAAVAVGVFTAYVLATAGPAKARPFATLDLLLGVAEVRLEEASFRRAVDGETLHQGDTVRTGERGRAEIEYFDGSLTRLDRGTTFTLTELVSDPGRTVVAGDQASGSTFNRVVELSGSSSRFDVATPTAVASVRGTTFFTDVGGNGSDVVGVLEGEVLVRGASGPTTVLQGQGVTVGPGGAVSAPFVLTADHLGSDWLFYNLCVLDQVQEICALSRPGIEKRPEADRDTRPEPVAIEEQAAPAASTPSDQPDEEEPPPAEQEEDKEEPPDPAPLPSPQPQPPAPEPAPPPATVTLPGNPPCDGPGQGTPCDGPGNAGNPPGQGSS